MILAANMTNALFDSVSTVVFAGGGNRCFWQAGFWDVITTEVNPKPIRILSVSAGAYVACGLLSGRIQNLLDQACFDFGRNHSNFHWARLVRGHRPFPHLDFYRTGLLSALNMEAFKVLSESTPIFIKTASPPKRLPLLAAVGLGFVGYSLEKICRPTVHATFGRALGFTPRWHSTHDCQSPTALVDLICASSCVPPFFPVARIDANVALDGGFIDSNPVSMKVSSQDTAEVDLGHTLVLLTRRYDRLPEVAGRIYLQPSRPLQVANFDSTAASGIRLAFQQGREDAFNFLRQPLRSPTGR